MRMEATSLSSFSASGSFSSSLLRSTIRASRPSIKGDLGLISRVLCFLRYSLASDFSWLWAASGIPRSIHCRRNWGDEKNPLISFSIFAV